ncbi:MAG TPA: hypothetical protein EYO73_01025, partial [Sulfurimonas sp.]|nr:hypothetical protein [Sulfurimonas sp.]
MKTIEFPHMGFYFMIVLIVAKLIYLGFESYYNGFVIDVVTSTHVDQDLLQTLESFGNRISSVGITLLIIPFYYLVVKKFFEFHQGVMLIVILLLTVSTYFAIHKGLNKAVFEIVKQNKDKRYESYYIELFKYGMLTGKLGYSSFIPKENLNHLSIYDKVMISNLFLLTQIDKDLIKKFVSRGKESFFDIYIHKYFQEDYNEARYRFEDMALRIQEDWDLYSDGIAGVNKKFSKIDSKEQLNIKYKKFTKDLKREYTKYRINVRQYTNVLNKNLSEATELNRDLIGYFVKDGSIMGKEEYEGIMKKYFGHDINPRRWCEGNICPATRRVAKVIEEETFSKWKKDHHDLPLNLSQKKFFKHPSIREKVVKQLRSRGINVSQSFNYSKKEYIAGYMKTVDAQFQKHKRKLQEEFAGKTGIVKVQLGLSFNQFANEYRKEIMLQYKEKRYGKIMYQMILEGDFTGFYERLYKPMLRSKYYDQAFPEEADFDIKLAEYGDTAIKMLYIPPFAIFMSLVAGLLNIVSVLVLIMFLYFHKDNSLKIFSAKLLAKILIFALLVYLPYSIGKSKEILKPYPVLDTFKDSAYDPYIKTLHWLLVVEAINYNSFYTLLMSGTLSTVE